MPARTPKQQRFFGYMQSHPAEAAARGITPKVAEEFSMKPKGGYPGKKTPTVKASKPKMHRNNTWGKF